MIDFDKTKAQLKKWEGRKPAINHYLGVVNDMSKYAFLPAEIYMY